MQNKKIIGIIPARGGSQRIPNKNIVDFHGLPMILYTLAAAQNSNLFHRIIVSTDCLFIKNVCDNAGFSVPFLRGLHYDDYSSVSQATITAINQAEIFFNEEYDIVIQLMPNSPLRTSQDILQQFKSFHEHDASFSISCTKFGWQNPWWSFEKKEDNTAKWMFKEALSQRSQDLSILYTPNGAIWIADVEKLKNVGTFYTPETRFFEMDFINSVDIDTYDDLMFAKKLFEIQKMIND